MDLIFESAAAAEEASTVSRRRGWRVRDPLEQRAARALALVQFGELSSARQALKGAELTPRNRRTLSELQNPARRPLVPREPIPEDLMELTPPQFDLDESLFGKSLRASKKGSAGGPSSMTTSLGFSAGHSLLVFGGRAVGTRTGSPVSCVFDPSRQTHSFE